MATVIHSFLTLVGCGLVGCLILACWWHNDIMYLLSHATFPSCPLMASLIKSELNVLLISCSGKFSFLAYISPMRAAGYMIHHRFLCKTAGRINCNRRSVANSYHTDCFSHMTVCFQAKPTFYDVNPKTFQPAAGRIVRREMNERFLEV